MVPLVQAKVAEMARRIVERFHPDKIVLFGSQARGTAGPESDVDLLVVMPVVGSKRQARVQIRLLIADLDLPKDVVVATPDEERRLKDAVGTIIRPALREGTILYERE